jgi:hypothetical protein
MSLVRACVSPGLADSRTLDAHVGERIHLAGLVAAAKETVPGGEVNSITLEDEWGLIEVRVTDAGGTDPGALGPVVVVDGEIEERHGVPVVVAARLEQPLPGTAAGLY